MSPAALPLHVVDDLARGRPVALEWTADMVASLVGHGLAAEVERSWMQQTDVPSGPSPLLIQEARRANLRSMAVAATILKLQGILTDAGTRAIIYKGAPLAVQTGARWLDRGSVDVDVLVAPEDLDRVHATLRRHALVLAGGTDRGMGWHRRYAIGESQYLGLAVPVDLHWRLDGVPGYFRATFENLWYRREVVSVGDLEVPTLGAIDALILTFVHGGRERWRRWRWLLDAHRQLSQLGSDNEAQLLERAREVGARRSVLAGAALASLAGATVVDPLRPTPGAIRVARRLLAETSRPHRHDLRLRSSLRRHPDRMRLADSPGVAVDGVLRALARKWPE